jgi:hypothetical protein
MPLFEFICLEGHRREVYCHVAEDRGAVTPICEKDGHTMALALSMGRGLCWFGEGRGRWIHNLGHEPVYVTSHEQHKKLMKHAGVEWATERKTQGRGGWI